MCSVWEIEDKDTFHKRRNSLWDVHVVIQLKTKKRLNQESYKTSIIKYNEPELCNLIY